MLTSPQPTDLVNEQLINNQTFVTNTHKQQQQQQFHPQLTMVFFYLFF